MSYAGNTNPMPSSNVVTFRTDVLFRICLENSRQNLGVPTNCLGLMRDSVTASATHLVDAS